MKQFCIRPDSTILECLKVIDTNAAGIALVTEEDLRLVGTVSDGDIRRALIKGYSLSTPVMPFINRDCYCVTTDVGRAEILDVMQARRFEQVPVLDEEGRLVGLHLLHDLLGCTARPNWAVIMAGGRGTRLRPFTENIPKPMLRVAGRPILERLILHLVSYGIRQIFISVNYMAHTIMDYFGDGSRLGCDIEYLKEEQTLGTAGPLSLIPRRAETPIMVLNGDLVTQFDAGAMLDWHVANNYAATVAVHNYVHTIPFGVVEVTASGSIASITEKPVASWQINAGIYVINPELIDRLDENNEATMPWLIETCLAESKTVGVFPVGQEWVDIGRPKDLALASGALSF